MDGRVEVSYRRRCMTASIAAPSGSKARDCLSAWTREFAPARLAREAQWSRANWMLARPSCPAPVALVTFPERKVTRAVGRRGKDMDVVLRSAGRATRSRQTAAIHGQELHRRDDKKVTLRKPCPTNPPPPAKAA